MSMDDDSNHRFSDTLPLAIVTGAGRRVGRLIALHLAVRGYAIALHYHNSQDEAEKTAGEISRLGVPVYPVKADLTIPAQVESMFAAIDGFPHRLTLLVNSAALMTPSNLLTMNVDDWNQVFDLNTRAVWLCSRAAASRMTLGGLILNLSDVGARKNWTRYGGYVVSKAALESLTRVLARQLAPRVRVCAIAPGLLMQAVGQSAEEWERLVDKVPLRRPADPIELLSAIDFLIDNHYITGEVINLAGGYQLV